MAKAGARVARLERAQAQAAEPARIVTADVWRWPEGARAALAAACAAGDREQQADLVEQHEGKRPLLGGTHVALILAWPSGPSGGDGS